MIAAVEGVSASGKTTWCARHSSRLVAELPAGSTPPAGDTLAIARFWTEAQSKRWRQAERTESALGAAFCDSDPLKLHYAWCLWQIGHHPYEYWRAAVVATRDAIRARKLGFADRIVFLEPDLSVVRRQKEQDSTRRRGNFDLHLRLGPTLRGWYDSSSKPVLHGERFSDVEPILPLPSRFSLELFENVVAMAEHEPPVPLA